MMIPYSQWLKQQDLQPGAPRDPELSKRYVKERRAHVGTGPSPLPLSSRQSKAQTMRLEIEVKALRAIVARFEEADVTDAVARRIVRQELDTRRKTLQRLKGHGPKGAPAKAAAGLANDRTGGAPYVDDHAVEED